MFEKGASRPQSCLTCVSPTMSTFMVRSCFFRSISDQLEGVESLHVKLREQVRGSSCPDQLPFCLEESLEELVRLERERDILSAIPALRLQPLNPACSGD